MRVDKLAVVVDLTGEIRVILLRGLENNLEDALCELGRTGGRVIVARGDEPWIHW